MKPSRGDMQMLGEILNQPNAWAETIGIVQARADRLRELGFREDQKIKLVARQSNFICQVCNARLAISGKLADSIMVEAVPASAREA